MELLDVAFNVAGLEEKAQEMSARMIRTFQTTPSLRKRSDGSPRLDWIRLTGLSND